MSRYNCTTPPTSRRHAHLLANARVHVHRRPDLVAHVELHLVGHPPLRRPRRLAVVALDDRARAPLELAAAVLVAQAALDAVALAKAERLRLALFP